MHFHCGLVVGTAALNRRHGKGYEYGPGGSILYPAAGAEDDWAKAKAGIKYSYTMELRPGERNNFLALGELLHKFSIDTMYHLDATRHFIVNSHRFILVCLDFPLNNERAFTLLPLMTNFFSLQGHSPATDSFGRHYGRE